jgi:hypothetical protein
LRAVPFASAQLCLILGNFLFINDGLFYFVINGASLGTGTGSDEAAVEQLRVQFLILKGELLAFS